ncbi:MAG: OmpA family protein [Phycisphaerales bacterium]|nr:OmpA family protein [Phycisphaeraceae bacterium]MCP4794896.1 OmpA family protein [Phycisphaeraceae bacterium]MDG1359017.1 OmpA family protein [Phycisphaerales bacterium]MDG1977766.1 OmpA family protein [Phycisphaerales bacterium]MDG2133244.1 OmpA family protein [Phycisphaerales bacterium]
MHGRLLLIGVLAAAASMAGCDTGNKTNQQALLDENRELRDNLASTQKNLDDAEARSRQLEYELGEANSLAEESAAQPVANAFGPGVEVFQSGGEMIVRIDGDVLFDSGRTSLKNAAKSTLKNIASEVRKSFPNAKVRITGFTDTDPIKKSGFKSNYHLGFERAYAVGRFLDAQGFDDDSISYATFGPDVPLGSKSKSRRVEVSVITDE